MESTPRENAALVEEFLTGVLADGDATDLGIFLADGVVDHRAIGSRPGRETATPWWRVLAAADPDVTIENAVAAAEMVAVQGAVSGIHEASLVALAPTGRSFEISAAWFRRIEDGGIARGWSIPDGLGLMRQLDAIPQQSGTLHNPSNRFMAPSTHDTACSTDELPRKPTVGTDGDVSEVTANAGS